MNLIYTLSLISLFCPILLWGQYCNSNATNSGDSEIDAIQLIGDLTNINNSTASVCATYSDFTGLTAADLIIGENYTIAVTLGTCGDDYSKEVVAYIDWNQDQDFDDAGEMVGRTSSTSSTATLNINFTAGGCGVSASLGMTRMRVVLTEGTVPGPCGTYSWGETEDYQVFVKAGTPSLDDYVLMDQAVEQASQGCVRLTENVGSQQGYAWAQSSVLNFSTNFSYDFTVNLGNNNGGADGILFVIQNDPNGICATGSGGWGAGGILNSLMIEIDTYLNLEDRDDGMAGVLCSGGIEPDHIDLWLNGNVNPSGSCGTSPGARIIPAASPLLNAGTDYDIENGLDHIFRINWNSGTITATILDATGTITYGTISYSFDPITVFGTMTPHYGFAASTGGLSNEQSFCTPLDLLLNEKLIFNAEKKDQSAILNWELKNEQIADLYEVEMSRDGFDFDVIHAEIAEGISAYQFEYPLFLGDYYFRIKHYQIDGSFYYSVIKHLNMKGEFSGFNAYPNPFGDHLSVQLPEQALGQLQLHLVNSLGQLIPLDFELSQQLIRLNTTDLSVGVYQLQIQYELDGDYLQKVIPLVKSF